MKNLYLVADYTKGEKHRSEYIEVSSDRNLLYEVRRLEDMVRGTGTELKSIFPYDRKREAMRVVDENNNTFKDEGRYLGAYEATHTDEEYQAHVAERAARQAAREAEWAAKNDFANEEEPFDEPPEGIEETPLPGEEYKYNACFYQTGANEYHLDLHVYNLDKAIYPTGDMERYLAGSWKALRQELYGDKSFPIGLPRKEDIAKYGDETLYISDDEGLGEQRVCTFREDDRSIITEFTYPSDLRDDYYEGLHNDYRDDLRHDEPAAEKSSKKAWER